MLIKVVCCILLCVIRVKADQVQVLPYIMVAYTTNGEPCIGGCSPTTHLCVDRHPPKESPCVIYNIPAPRFRLKYSRSDYEYCLSNCGKFTSFTAWCYVDADGSWEYCNETGESNNLSLPTTTTTKPIATVTEPATKVPVLPCSYTTSAQSQKGNCDSFFRKFSNDLTHWNQYKTAYDGFIKEKADAIERYAKTSSDIKVKRIDKQNIAVKSYTLVDLVLPNGRNASIPVVLRARITNETIKHLDAADRSGDVSENVDELYEWFYNRRSLIGTDIGGTNDSYNFVPQSDLLRKVLTNIEQVVRTWCIDGKESVDMVIVVFYPEIPTKMPHAIGLDLTFNNRDDSVFVRCRDSLYFNLL